MTGTVSPRTCQRCDPRKIRPKQIEPILGRSLATPDRKIAKGGLEGIDAEQWAMKAHRSQVTHYIADDAEGALFSLGQY